MTNWCISRIKSLEKTVVKLNDQVEALDETYMSLTDRIDTMEAEISDLEEAKNELDDDIKRIIRQAIKKHLMMAFDIKVPDGIKR
jgi:peptidoglycan hydrolase CwlO-like protein